MKHIMIFFIALVFVVVSCADSNKEIRLKNGRWRAEFLVQGQKIPFIFEVHGADSDTASVMLINGQEKVKLTGITYNNDTVTIPIEAYDSELRGIISRGRMTGYLLKNYVENDKGIEFEAGWNNDSRFATTGKKSPIKLDGKWDIQFVNPETGDIKNNVGIFSEQANGMTTGSIATSTGDLRYLDGYVNESGFELSSFSGLNPYLIKATFADKDNFEGYFYTPGGITNLRGSRNNNASLADPYSLTTLKEGYDKLDFRLPNIEGKLVSLSDSQYQNKVVIVSILGSWCPNCLDEMAYLSPWYKENKIRGVEIIGLAFERKDDPEYARKVLSKLKNRYNVPYELLFAGKVGSESTEKALPQIEKIMSYPTTLFIDKQGKVRKIHTGFNGPATGLFYNEFQQDFNKLVDELLNE